MGPETLRDSSKVTKGVLAERGPRALPDGVQGKRPNGPLCPHGGVLRLPEQVSWPQNPWHCCRPCCCDPDPHCRDLIPVSSPVSSLGSCVLTPGLPETRIQCTSLAGARGTGGRLHHHCHPHGESCHVHLHPPLHHLAHCPSCLCPAPSTGPAWSGNPCLTVRDSLGPSFRS